jgi:thymidylate synthase (FAD)
MKVIRANFSIETQSHIDHMLSNIERAGRTCYKSEPVGNYECTQKFVEKIIKLGHESVLEHESITVRIICDRGVSHEIVRHRIASYSQESTRYCNYSSDKFDNEITVIQPCWFENDWTDEGIEKETEEESEKRTTGYTDEFIWFRAMRDCETGYFELLKKGWSPQQARSVLPNSLKTEIVVTMNLREWRHFFKLRCSLNAHPQMREIAVPLLNEMKRRLPVIFDDINIGGNNGK